MPAALAAQVIRDLLAAYRLSATVFPDAESGGSWRLGAGAARKGVFHMVQRGVCRLELRGRPPLQLEAGSERKRGFVAMLADPRVGRALAAIHGEPERDWHIGTLAALAGMSRTAFAGAFSAGVGQPPMQYLAQWRMRRAAALLRDRRNSIGALASRLGYRSEAAFRRAFKRIEGIPPGALRG